ncbi:MAG: hypothetical protein JO022_09980 [Acidobacteriaceae bacterium]|nr:hypothetical protein [Acidobacteriaceae bacterium]
MAASTIAINSTVQASPSSKRGPKAPGIVLTSAKTDGVAVDISNTGELLAVLDAARPGKDGKVQITSAGGAIQINGHIDASNGTTEIRNYGTNGAVNIADATIHGDVVKIGAMGNNGTLTVGGGSISADTLLKLYAGGTNGAVVFNNDVALNGQSAKIIAGRTVTIRDGKTVTIGGNNPARVFTDIPNYSGSGGNGSTSGRFGGQGATTQSFGAAPRF